MGETDQLCSLNYRSKPWLRSPIEVVQHPQLQSHIDSTNAPSRPSVCGTWWRISWVDDFQPDGSWVRLPI